MPCRRVTRSTVAVPGSSSRAVGTVVLVVSPVQPGGIVPVVSSSPPAPGPLLVFGPRSLAYDFGPHHPLTPLRFGPGIDLLRAVGAEPGLAPSPAADADLLGVHLPAYVEAVRAFSGDPTRPPRWASVCRTTLPSPGCTRRPRPSRADRWLPWTRSCVVTPTTRSTPGAAFTTRWRRGHGASASTTMSRWRLSGHGPRACGCCTSTSTCTTGTACRQPSCGIPGR